MQWSGKIKAKTTFEDGSPEMKKGELKRILIDCFARRLKELPYVGFDRGVYRFRRKVVLCGFQIWQTVELIHSFAGRNITCSVSSCPNTIYLAHKNQYNNGLLNPRYDLIALGRPAGGVLLEESCYFHNGRIYTTTKRVEEISSDVIKFGIPFFEQHLQLIRNSPILSIGFDFIRNLDVSRSELIAEMRTDLERNRHLISRIESPAFLQLKRILQSVPDQDREVRKQIPKLAYELLELYCSTE